MSTTLAPDFAWPHLNRGLALARSGRLPEARVAYDRALELIPDFTEALVDRALACLELGDWDQATGARLGPRYRPRSADPEHLGGAGRRTRPSRPP